MSLGMILIMTSAMTLINLFENVELPGYQGLINFRTMLPMVIGILIASPFGVQVAHKSRGRYIELTFIIFTIIVLIDKIYILIS